MIKAVGLLSTKLFLLICCLCLPAKAGPVIHLEVRVTQARGAVEFLDSATGKWTPLKDGDTLNEKADVRTGNGGACILTWPGGNSLLLEPRTAIELNELEMIPQTGETSSSIKLQKGKILGRAPANTLKRQYRIIMPEAEAFMTAALFSAETTPGGAGTVMCAEGRCRVLGPRGNSMNLRAGQKTSFTRADAVAAPRKMSKAEISAIESAEGVANPELLLFHPAGDLETGSSSETVRGRVRPGTSVIINNTKTEVDDRGYFSAPFDLAPGKNEFTIQAINMRGLITSASRTVKFGSGKQAAANPFEEQAVYAAANGPAGIVSPRDGSITRETSVSVSGSASGPSILLVNGRKADSVSGAAVFAKRVPLDEGENIVTLSPENGAGESISVRIARDTTPPDLSIAQPFNLFEAFSPGCFGSDSSLSCEVAGKTEPGAVVNVNGARVETGPDGSFSIRALLARKQSSIIIYAEDKAGNLNTQILQRAYNPLKIVDLSISISPSSIIANNVNTAIVTVSGNDLLGLPVTGTVVTLSATPGGTLTPETVTLVNGAATAIFRGGIGAARNNVTITASSGIVSSAANILLLPDAPPVFDN